MHSCQYLLYRAPARRLDDVVGVRPVRGHRDVVPVHAELAVVPAAVLCYTIMLSSALTWAMELVRKYLNIVNKCIIAF